MNQPVILALISNLLDDAEHLRNRLETGHGTPVEVNERAALIAESIRKLYQVVKETT